MLNFIYLYGWIIVALIFAGLYFYELYKKQGKAAALEKLRLAAFKLMILAEKQFGKGNGEFKFTWVVDNCMHYFPILQRYLSQGIWLKGMFRNGMTN